MSTKTPIFFLFLLIVIFIMLSINRDKTKEKFVTEEATIQEFGDSLINPFKLTEEQLVFLRDKILDPLTSDMVNKKSGNFQCGNANFWMYSKNNNILSTRRDAPTNIVKEQCFADNCVFDNNRCIEKALLEQDKTRKVLRFPLAIDRSIEDVIRSRNC